MNHATTDEIAEVLGDLADESIVERIAAIGVSIEEVREALEDLEFQLRFGELREPASPVVEEIRSILEEMPALENLIQAELELGEEEIEPDQELREQLTLVEGEELARHR